MLFEILILKLIILIYCEVTFITHAPSDSDVIVFISPMPAVLAVMMYR